MLKVNEIFYSIQGEGINMGRFAVFVRLAGCNLRCSWCDTKYAFDEGTEMSSEQLTREILKVDPNPEFIVFTGGEPMLQAEDLYRFVGETPESISGLRVRLGVETNGSIHPPDFVYDYVDHVAVSPKTPYDVAVLSDWVILDATTEFKFVVDSQDDLQVIYTLTRELRLCQGSIPVILQPNGLKKPYSKALEELVGWVREYPELIPYVRILPQLHRIIWKGKRGK